MRVDVGFYSRNARPTEVFKLVLSLGAQITRTGTYACTHAHRQARARTPYYHGTQTKTKVDVQSSSQVKGTKFTSFLTRKERSELSTLGLRR